MVTPIPRYKFGRNGGREELAIVGDGGVHEVIEHEDGSAEVTPKRDTLVKLLKGNKVHSSIEKYRQSKRNKFRNDFITVTKKKNMSTVVNVPKVDIAHELRRMKQLEYFK